MITEFALHYYSLFCVYFTVVMFYCCLNAESLVLALVLSAAVLVWKFCIVHIAGLTRSLFVCWWEALWLVLRCSKCHWYDHVIMHAQSDRLRTNLIYRARMKRQLAGKKELRGTVLAAPIKSDDLRCCQWIGDWWMCRCPSACLCGCWCCCCSR